MATKTIPLSQLEEAINAGLEKSIKQASIECFTNIINNTPVDTGRLVGGYGINGGEYGVPSNQSSKIADVKEEINKLKVLDEEFTLDNDAPYAKYIEYGSATNAPVGMIRRNEAEYESILSNAVKRNL